jgi:hypothetical protein
MYACHMTDSEEQRSLKNEEEPSQSGSRSRHPSQTSTRLPTTVLKII